MAPLLDLQGVTKRFGGLIAVNNVNLAVDMGTITSVIGPNGAGKTTIFNTITGIYKPDEGDVQFDGQSIAGKRPDQITALGMCRTFQNIRLFHNMSVLENVMVGGHTQSKSTVLGAVLRTGGVSAIKVALKNDVISAQACPDGPPLRISSMLPTKACGWPG